MELTREMITSVDNQIDSCDNEMLKVFHNTYKSLNTAYPNGYYKYMADKSCEILKKRGLEP